MKLSAKGGGVKAATFQFNERRKKYCQITG